MEIKFSKITDDKTKTDLLNHMTHDGIVKHLNALLYGGVPYDKIMAELKPADYRKPLVVISLKNAGADPRELLDLVGLEQIPDLWQIPEIGLFYDDCIGDELLGLFNDISDLARICQQLYLVSKQVPEPLLEKHIRRILGDPATTDALVYTNVRTLFEYHVEDFLNVGLDADVALKLSDDWTQARLNSYKALLEHGADPFIVWQKIDNTKKLALYRIWKDMFVNISYKDIVLDSGYQFMDYIDELLEGGADAQWLADQVSRFTTHDVFALEDLLKHGADFETLKDRIDPELLISNFEGFKALGIDPHLKRYFNAKIKKEQPLSDRLQDLLDHYASWLVTHKAVDDGLLLNSLSGIGLQNNFEELLNFYEHRPALQSVLISCVIAECSEGEINQIVPHLLIRRHYEKLLEMGAVTKTQLKVLIEQYLDIEHYRNYLKIKLVLQNLDLVQELCPDFDIQDFVDHYPERYGSTALIDNLATVLDHHIKVDWERVFADHDSTSLIGNREILEIMVGHGYDVNWCLKDLQIFYRIRDKRDVKFLMDLGADRDLLAFIYLNQSDATVQEMDDLFNGPTIWSGITTDD